MTWFNPRALVLFVAGVWSVTLIVMGVGVPQGFWKPLTIVAAIMSVAFWAYENHLWACIHPWLMKLPDLRGTWQGTLRSEWTDPDTGEKVPPIEAYFTIEQTASTIQVSMMTKESHSSTTTARIEKRDGVVQVIGVYRNEPHSDVRERSAIHYGGLRLRVGGPPAAVLQGDYWTDRSTTGSIAIERCTRILASDFNTAQALCAGHVQGSMPA